jgi:mono/diheme cytochrome c family protein
MSSGIRRARTQAGLFGLTLLAFGALGSRAALSQEIFAGKFPQQSGEDLYKNICQGCHMPDAKGAVGAGAYPALASDPRLAVPIYPITVVLRGQRAMISLGESLNDEQVANVLNYVRTHFGNRYKDVVTPAAVAARRAALMQDAATAPPPATDPRAAAH